MCLPSCCEFPYGETAWDIATLSKSSISLLNFSSETNTWVSMLTTCKFQAMGGNPSHVLYHYISSPWQTLPQSSTVKYILRLSVSTDHLEKTCIATPMYLCIIVSSTNLYTCSSYSSNSAERYQAVWPQHKQLFFTIDVCSFLTNRYSLFCIHVVYRASRSKLY